MNAPARPAVSRRARYLAALGIDLWTARAQPAPSLLPSRPLPSPLPLSPLPPAPEAAEERVSRGKADIPGKADPDAWQTLRVQVEGCRLCGLCQSRTQTVFGVGDTRAPLMIIGEAPGAEEDRQGEPFVGRAGQLLNAMLQAMGQPRQTVYIANILKCRPPGNRDPSPTEVASCLPYLHRQIDLLSPRLILVVGRIAAQSLLATDTSIGRLRGHLHRYGAQGTPLMVTYHPAYLLRSPAEKRRVWADLKAARAELARDP